MDRSYSGLKWILVFNFRHSKVFWQQLCPHLLQETRIIDLLKVFQVQIGHYTSQPVESRSQAIKQQLIPSSHLDVLTAALVLQVTSWMRSRACIGLEAVWLPFLVRRALEVFQTKPVFLFDHNFSSVFKPQAHNTIMRNLVWKEENNTLSPHKWLRCKCS